MSHSKANLVTFKAGAAITRGMAVKFGADAQHVVKGAANTDACIGIAQGDAAAAEDLVEVAIPGGGGVAKAGEGITKGKLLVSHTDGTLVQTNAANDRIVAMASEDASTDDVFAVEVLVGIAGAADQ